ncbi:alpha/beta fold hydrolase [Gordonia sp. ABSL11-1]|uniref:alpha/beta fold hydrolase n=1 Tax=Gordonia sp. ABSL11-1 TaxID=3053924 RepID=UPI0025731B20|nr:alpha/beta fold hydrolase [Gordonia sp. ABSL11-1]MDL9947733.1 alpha/beta fold hydrolase [Gordonia sp. ABSL11-1]
MPAIEGSDPRGPQLLIGMPGTGSDADYVRRAFGPAADESGLTLVALEPSERLVADHLRRLDELADVYGPPVVGGVSIGAAIALAWALQNPCGGVWAALPAWTGDPATAPAAWSATATARALQSDGLEHTIAMMSATSPPWLAAELGRSWRALHPRLLDQLAEAASFRAPGLDDIATLTAPIAVTIAVDDPVHPGQVGRDWATAAPRSSLTEVGLEDWGNDPSILGFACARGWSAMRGPTGPVGHKPPPD